MSQFVRFAIYYLPPDGPLAEFGARWLGWDVGVGQSVAHPTNALSEARVEEVTRTPRKYGFHGTLKPPFRLAEGTDGSQLHTAVKALAASLAPVTLDGLRLARLGHFLALVPEGDMTALGQLAARCVTEPDRFRAPAPEAELTRRRAAGLTARQEDMLRHWGYPYVLEEFRFHLTLTGRLQPHEMDEVEAALALALPALPRPYIIDQIALAGERSDGQFQLIHRYALTG